MLDSQQLARQQSVVVTEVRVQLLVRVSGLSVRVSACPSSQQTENKAIIVCKLALCAICGVA